MLVCLRRGVHSGFWALRTKMLMLNSFGDEKQILI